MPTRWDTFPVEVGGGLTEILPSIQQGMKAPGSAIFLSNFEPSLKGGYRRINGFTKFSDSVVPSTDNTTQLLGIGFLDGEVIVPREGKIYSSTGSGWTEIATGRTQTTKHRYARVNYDGTRTLIGVDGLNYPYSYDGTTFTDLNGSTDVLGASHAISFKDHTFYAKDDLVSFTVPFTTNDFTVADGAGNFRMPNEVTGMIVFRERLFIFTETEIMVLDGDSVVDWRLTSVSESVGCIKEDTIAEVAGDVMFLAADGLRLLGATDRNGDFANESASKNIQTLITTFEDSWESFHAVTIREKSQYRIFGYDVDIEATAHKGFLGTQFEAANPNSLQWAQLSGIKLYAAVSEVYAGDEIVYFVGGTEYVYIMESGKNFDGTTISAEYRTPFLSLTEPTVRKTVYKVKTYVEAEGDVSGTLSLSFDQGSTARVQPGAEAFSGSGGAAFGEAVFGVDLFATGAVEGSFTTNHTGSGYSVSVEYRFTSDQEPFIIDTVFVQYSQEDRK